VSGHANPCVQARRPRERGGVDVEVTTLPFAGVERAERVSQKRLAQASATVGPADAEHVDVATRRILYRLGLRAEVTG
jgi:hypothetical protein